VTNIPERVFNMSFFLGWFVLWRSSWTFGGLHSFLWIWRTHLTLSWSMDRMIPLKNIRMPSIKRRCVRYTWFFIAIPLNVPWEMEFAISMLKHSSTIRKKSGERGHPCLIPLSYLNKWDVSLLISIEKYEELIQFRIQVKKMWEKPRCIKIMQMYN